MTTEPIQIKGFQHLGEFLKANGYTVTPPETSDTETKETESETKNDSETKTEETLKQEEKTETKQPETNIVQFMLGTPNNTDQNHELTEEKIMVMTPEQIQKNMPKIREHILANGGKF